MSGGAGFQPSTGGRHKKKELNTSKSDDSYDNTRSFEILTTNHFPKQTGNKTAEK